MHVLVVKLVEMERKGAVACDQEYAVGLISPKRHLSQRSQLPPNGIEMTIFANPLPDGGCFFLLCRLLLSKQQTITFLISCRLPPMKDFVLPSLGTLIIRITSVIRLSLNAQQSLCPPLLLMLPPIRKPHCLALFLHIQRWPVKGWTALGRMCRSIVEAEVFSCPRQPMSNEVNLGHCYHLPQTHTHNTAH